MTMADQHLHARVWLVAVLLAVATIVVSIAPRQPEATASASYDFTVHYRYDIAGRLVGTINPDPDGAGPNRHAAVRNTYDPDTGLLVRVEHGELAAIPAATVAPADWTGFTVWKVATTDYDDVGRPTLAAVEVDGIRQAVTQSNYYTNDGRGQLFCQATRMNPNAFNNPPVDACSLGPEGDHGPDRITHHSYTNKGDLRLVKKAYGTSLQQDYVTRTYTPARQPEYITDANGNKAKMQYDGHGRLYRWYFPSKTSTGSHSTTDYEQYGYDPNGNRTSYRKRDGRTINYQYDDLNRLRVEDLPNTTIEDIYFKYDLRGLKTASTLGGPVGPGVLQTYDGFGRVTSSTKIMGGSTRILQYRYDKGGNRIRITHPDNTYFEYEYDGLNRNDGIFNAFSQELIDMSYHPQGQRDELARLNGTTTRYAFDSLGRLDYFIQDLSEAFYDARYDFGYSPANQVVNLDISNDVYHYSCDDNLTGGYQVNGLNQYTSVNGTTYGYDANGNLTSDGSNTYVYDIYNRLTSVSGTNNATLAYDPLGRLHTVTSNGATTEFLYDGDALIAEYQNGQLQRRYVHGPSVDEPLIWYEGADTDTTSARYLHSNQQRSIVTISDHNGTGLQTNQYDVYGIPGANNLGRFAFTGQIFLPEIDLYHYKARLYSPKLGRFMQTDPVGYEDQMNLYAYVGNDPMNWMDSTGMYIEVGFEAASLAMGATSFVQNVKKGNVGGATVDAVGLVADAVLVAIPGAPGVVGAAIGAARMADNIPVTLGDEAWDVTEEVVGKMKDDVRVFRAGDGFDDAGNLAPAVQESGDLGRYVAVGGDPMNVSSYGGNVMENTLGNLKEQGATINARFMSGEGGQKCMVAILCSDGPTSGWTPSDMAPDPAFKDIK